MEFEMEDSRDIHMPITGDGYRQHDDVSPANVDPEESAEDHDQAIHIPEQDD